MIGSLELDESLPSAHDVADIFDTNFAILSVYEEGKIILESDLADDLEFESEEEFFSSIHYDEKNCIYLLRGKDEEEQILFSIREDMYPLLESIFDE